jgi:uncharacterized protein (TIGR03089 family)
MHRISLHDLTASPPDASRVAADWAGLPSYISAGVRRDPAKPFLTWYDDETGERVELSYATFANWVWKTGNFLREGLDVAPGDNVVTMLRTHWQTVAIWFACWSVGAVAVPVEPGTVERYGALTAAAVFAQQDLLPLAVASRASLGEVVGLSLRPMAARIASPPPGVLDYAEEVPSYGDQLGSGPSASLTAQALPGITGAQLIAGAAASGAVMELTPGERLMCTLPVTDPDLLIAVLVAAFHAGAGLVLCRSTPPSSLWRRVRDERVGVLISDSRTVDAAGSPSDVPGLRLMATITV